MPGPAKKAIVARSMNVAAAVSAVMVGGLLFADVRAEDKATSEPLYVSWDEDDPLCADIYRNRRRIEIIEPIRTTGHDAPATINEVLGYGLKELDPRNPPAKTVPYFTKAPMDRATIERLLAAQDWNTLFEAGEAPPDKGFLPGPIHTDPFWRDLHRRCPELLTFRNWYSSPGKPDYQHAYTHLSLYRVDFDGDGKDDELLFGTTYDSSDGKPVAYTTSVERSSCKFISQHPSMSGHSLTPSMFRFKEVAYYADTFLQLPDQNLGKFYVVRLKYRHNRNVTWDDQCKFHGPPSPRDLRDGGFRISPHHRKRLGIGPYE